MSRTVTPSSQRRRRVEPIASADAAAILESHGQTTNDYLKSLRGRFPGAPAALLDAIDYSLLAGGKRLRPALILECLVAHGGEASEKSPPFRAARAAAGAIELIHTFSLVHDDLPAMDNDDLRRGRPTNHKVFGEAMAILAGDAMVTMAFEIIANDAEPATACRLIAELASATGPGGMIGGQVLDMAGEKQSLTLEQLQQVHRLKTGALITVACRLGAIAAGATSEAKLQSIASFGRHLGLAFQIVDDVLDVTATPEQLGKATGKDASKGKNTYPGLLGLEASRREAAKQLDQAIAAVADLGNAAAGLRALARFVGERNR
ncbi:MAG TPA: farnesyl diphosphate synthase [Tepidisphaeraceae bacterium]|jgi:geranylgeranyl diphosphate synthase type II|nr:farnesyl diphosphate synthase [Tepidisphaeraceae bacterium]